jgi:uncharacterized protein YfaS (alpha-2-macroglobulin family)
VTEEAVASGQRVEAVLTIEAKNNYEYLLFEDLKPGGLEGRAIAQRREICSLRKSSRVHSTGKKSELMNYGATSDFTAARVGFTRSCATARWHSLLIKLPEGVWQVSYEMRAESPGAFHALPCARSRDVCS